MTTSYLAPTGTHVPSSSSFSSKSSSHHPRRRREDGSSLGDPSLASSTDDGYTTTSSHASRVGAHRSRHRTAAATTTTNRMSKAAAAVPGNGRIPPGGVFDLRDLRLTSRDTDQQAIIWNDLAASRRKLEEENQLLRDKLVEAQVVNRVLRVKIKQRGGAPASAGSGGILRRGSDRGTVPQAETGREAGSLLRKVFSRREAFRNPVAPGIKRFQVSTAPRGLPLPPMASAPSSSQQVQHVRPLPENDHENGHDRPLPLAYYVARKSSERSTRTPPAEIVVPTASSPETVPESNSSSTVSPSNSPSSSASPRPMTPTLRHQPQEPHRPPQQPRSGNHRHSQYHHQQQQAQGYSLMRVLPLRRQETTESTATVPHANHNHGAPSSCIASNHNNRTGSRRTKQPMSPGSAPELPILMEDPGYDEDDVSGCQPSSTMMMITTSAFPTSILERLAGARIGSSSSDHHHHPDGIAANASGTGPATAIVLSACTPLWYDEPEQYYVPPTRRGVRRDPTKYSPSSHENY